MHILIQWYNVHVKGMAKYFKSVVMTVYFSEPILLFVGVDSWSVVDDGDRV